MKKNNTDSAGIEQIKWSLYCRHVWFFAILLRAIALARARAKSVFGHLNRSCAISTICPSDAAPRRNPSLGTNVSRSTNDASHKLETVHSSPILQPYASKIWIRNFLHLWTNRIYVTAKTPVHYLYVQFIRMGEFRQNELTTSLSQSICTTLCCGCLTIPLSKFAQELILCKDAVLEGSEVAGGDWNIHVDFRSETNTGWLTVWPG